MHDMSKEHLFLMVTALTVAIEELLVTSGASEKVAQETASAIRDDAGAFAARVGSTDNLIRMARVEERARASARRRS